MPIAVIIYSFLFVLVCVVFIGYTHAPKADKASETTIKIEKIQSMTQEQITEKLKQLKARETPELRIGAMCYEMASPPKRAEYVCPKCGEKTLYKTEDAASVIQTFPFYHRSFARLKAKTNLSLELDESSFCAHCSPNAKQHELKLIVTYADGSTHTTAPISSHDLIILNSFFADLAIYATENEGTESLKKELPRIRELLGINDVKDSATLKK